MTVKAWYEIYSWHVLAFALLIPMQCVFFFPEFIGYLCDSLNDNVFPPYSTWKALVWSRISSVENLEWASVPIINWVCLRARFQSVRHQSGFWSSVFAFPDLRKKKSLHLRLLIGSNGFNIDTGAWTRVFRVTSDFVLCVVMMLI